MGAWHTRGLRGSVLEECINFTNDYYRQKGIAVNLGQAVRIGPRRVAHPRLGRRALPGPLRVG